MSSSSPLPPRTVDLDVADLDLGAADEVEFFPERVDVAGSAAQQEEVDVGAALVLGQVVDATQADPGSLDVPRATTAKPVEVTEQERRLDVVVAEARARRSVLRDCGRTCGGECVPADRGQRVGEEEQCGERQCDHGSAPVR
jgi:hypothetical protein